MNFTKRTIKTILKVLLGLNLLIAGIGHLSWARTEFLAQVPNWLPLDGDFVVVASGVVEIILGVLLLTIWKKAKAKTVGIVVAIFFVLVFPGNISQYLNEINAFGLDSDLKRLIRLFFQPVLVIWALWSCDRGDKDGGVGSIYDIKLNKIDGGVIDLKDYQQNILLIVNTASKCGLTSQYEGLEKLYEKYKEQGLVVMGFPCNQFASQEPGDSESIQDFCRANFSINFPMFKKIDVNGENTHPLYRVLKKRAPGLMGTKNIKWNFTKFLVLPKEKMVKRFAPTKKPSGIEKDIKLFLKRGVI